MPTEIERKFIIDPKKLPPEALSFFYDTEAGYFTHSEVAIRVTSRFGGKQKVCFKGPVTDVKTGARLECEYLIPNEDARQLLALSPTNIRKRRYEYQGWEIDKFEFLVGGKEFWMAEYEEKEGKPPCPDPLPPWVEKEVTGESIYSNQALAWAYGKKN